MVEETMGATPVQTEIQPEVEDTPTPSPALLALLKSRLPHSFPVLRRLQFALNFAAIGRTPHTHVLYARYPHHHHRQGDGDEGHFAVACVDLSRGPETQV